MPIFRTVQEALTLGGDKLAVDGVILIGEHGDYPVNDKAQTLYPRFEMFLKITEVFRQSGRSAPVFNDKHLLRGVLASLAWAGLAAFFPALASFFGEALALPLAAFWPFGASFFGLAPFFEEAFSGATCAPCSAAAEEFSVIVASAFVMVVNPSALSWRMTIHHSGGPEMQGQDCHFRRGI